MSVINTLKNQFKYGTLVNCRYELIVIPPSDMNDPSLTYKLSVLGKGITMPKREVQTKSFSYRGRPIVLRSQLRFDPTVSISVYEDSDMNVRKLLSKWLDRIDKVGGASDKYRDGQIILYQLDNYGTELYGVRFNDVFITAISEISYSADSKEMLTYSIDFAYSGCDEIAL